MKQLIVVISVLLALSATALASEEEYGDLAPGLLAPLSLPADKILRISSTLVEFEHHGFIPISPEVQCFQHWEDESCPYP